VSQSFRRFLTRHVACPLNDWRKGVAGRQWREFEAVDRMTRDQVLALQEARLRDFLRWAGAQSPFYERVFRETGFDPDAPDVRAELQRIPPIDKRTVREHREEMLPREYAARRGSLFRKSTSGSTGLPLTLYGDREDLHQNRLRAKRQARWVGCERPGVKVVLYGSVKMAPSVRAALVAQQVLKRLLLNVHKRNTYDARWGDYARLAADLRRNPPDALYAYFSILRHLAYEAEKQGEPFRGIGLAVAISEAVPDNERREAERWLATRIYGQYSCREVGAVAHECREQAGYHYAQDHMLIEALDDQGRPAQTGNLTVTYMGNRATPLIRYQLGDLVTLDTTPCPCGLPYDRLRGLDGRVAHMMVLPGGRKLPANVISVIMGSCTGVWQYQAEQVAPDRIVLRVTRREGQWDEASFATACAAFRTRLGPQVHVEWRFDEPFIATPGGKHLPFIPQGGRPAA
jgi:phenylacetate-CoA ligase